MPFQKGHKKHGGRKKGSGLNETVREILAKLDCNPVEGLASIAMDPDNKKELQARAYSYLMEYVWPKRKSVEFTGVDGGPIEVNVSAREQLLSRIAGLATRK